MIVICDGHSVTKEKIFFITVVANPEPDDKVKGSITGTGRTNIKRRRKNETKSRLYL